MKAYKRAAENVASWPEWKRNINFMESCGLRGRMSTENSRPAAERVAFINNRLRNIAQNIQQVRSQDYQVDNVFVAHARIDVLADQMDNFIAAVQDILEAL